MDSIVIKVRDNQRVVNKAIFVALGINLSGNKDLLGLWLTESEGAKFWPSFLTELKNRGVEDILITYIGKATWRKSRLSIQTPKFNCALFIWFATTCALSAGKTTSVW